MERNVTKPTATKNTSRSPQAVPKTKYTFNKEKTGHKTPKRDCSKTSALQEALQDPITIYEGN